MATKKTTKKAKKDTVTYKGQEYELIEESGNMVKLTDGLIHFWVKKKDVTA